jgi:Tol biopolymer transport system component
MRSGNEREVPGTAGLVPVAWMPDGRSILARPSDGNERTLLRINVQTGEKEESIRLPGTPGAGGRDIAVSRDGKAVYYGLDRRLMRRNLETGREDEITGEVRRLALFLSLSPDGRLLAFACHPNLCLVPAEGGAIRELQPGPEYFVGSINWSRDGKHIIAPAYEKGGLDRTPVRLWSVPLDGGAAELAAPPQAGDQGLFFGYQTSVSPDGAKVAFAWTESKSELWVLENFLPVSTTAAK